MRCRHCGAEIISIHAMGGPAICWASPITCWPAQDVGLEDMDSHDAILDPQRDTERQTEGKALLEQAASVATPKEASIIRLLVDGFALHEAARLLRMPRAVAMSCMENFCCRARAVIG